MCHCAATTTLPNLSRPKRGTWTYHLTKRRPHDRDQLLHPHLLPELTGVTVGELCYCGGQPCVFTEVRMLHHTVVPRYRLVAAILLLCVAAAHRADAQGFISGSYGYNFSGSAGCRTATDCVDKNWNWGGSLGVLGSVVGFEAEITHESEFTGESALQKSSLTTLMGDFMLAPKISIVQPFGVLGIGVIKTKVNDGIVATDNSENDIGWSIGGGLIVYVNKHIGLKGDLRYYRSFSALELLNIELGQDRNNIDFGRAGFGVVLKF